MSLREDVELYTKLYTKLSGEDGSQETIATIGAYLRGYRQGKEDAEPHWIPVTDRLPNKEEKSYWVCLEGGGQCQCRWTNDVYGLGANEWSKWGWKKVDLPQYSKVVAYMPLPEPYKGVTT